MKPSTLFAWLLAVLLATACQSSGTETETTTAEETAEAPATAAASIQLTEAGLNGIDDQMPFTVDAISAKLPAFTFTERNETSGAGAQRIIAGSLAGGIEQLFFTADATGQRVESIHLLRGNFLGPEGQQPEKSFAQTQGAVYDCYPGTGDLSGLAVCSNGPTSNIQYVYRHGWNGPASEMPKRNTLTCAPLVQMIWQNTPEKSDPALTQALNSFLKSKGVRPDTSRYQIAWVDLNYDLKTDAVVLMEGGDWCGPAGCTMLVFDGAASPFRLVTEIGFVSKPVILTTAVSRGWRSFIVQLLDKGAMPMQYDGESYPESPVNEAPMGGENIPGRVLFE